MLREVHVQNYKNLRSVRVEVTDRVVLYGRNGTGKSNLLEALALVAGDPITLGQVARRAATPDPGAIEVVLDATDLLDDLVSTRQAEKAGANALFWATLGLDDGVPSSWADGIESSWLPDEVQAALIDRSRCAVRYSLSSLAGLDAVAMFDRGRLYRDDEDDDDPRQAVKRTFDRTLCVPRDVGERLRQLNVNLPDSARPLLADHPATGDWSDVLTLPPTTSIPLQVVWLARERSDDDIWYDFVRSIDEAANGVSLVMHVAPKALDQLDWPADITDDARWVAKAWFADHAQAAVRTLLPHIELSPEDDWLTIFVQTDIAREARLGGPGDRSWFTALSSGERALVDEALLDAAQALREDMWAAIATAAMLHKGEPDADLLDLQVELEGRLDILGNPDVAYFSREDVDALVLHGERWWAQHFGRPPSRRAPHVVRLFDEPERHLHSGARDELAAALHSRATSDTIVVATHAVEFLARGGWNHVHLFASPEGITAAPFTPGELDRMHGVARDLGLRSGELLTRYRYLLLVEGPHDEAFLHGYCGDLLRSLGVLVLPMLGVDEALQAAQAQLLVRHLDIGIGVLADHARSPGTKEARLLDELARVARRRGVQIDQYRLKRPDIVGYLSDDQVRAEAPEFPGFHEVEPQWRQPPRATDFKQLASDLAGGLRFGRGLIQDLAARTASSGHPPPPDLALVLATLADNARRASTPTG